MHTLSMSQPRLASRSNRIGPAFDFNDVDSFCVDNENAVSGASETRVIDGVASDSAISRIAAIPAAQLGNRYAMTSRFSGSRRSEERRVGVEGRSRGRTVQDACN